jgi:hypothetical protein
VKYGEWQEDDIGRALAAVRNGDMGINAAARTYSIPRATLQRSLAEKYYFAVENKKVIGSTADLPGFWIAGPLKAISVLSILSFIY